MTQSAAQIQFRTQRVVKERKSEGGEALRICKQNLSRLAGRKKPLQPPLASNACRKPCFSKGKVEGHAFGIQANPSAPVPLDSETPVASVCVHLLCLY